MVKKGGKKVKGSDGGDSFWSRVLVISIVIIWISLVGGNWLGHYLVNKGFLAKKNPSKMEFKPLPAQKPEPWKKPLEVQTEEPKIKKPTTITSGDEKEGEKTPAPIDEDEIPGSGAGQESPTPGESKTPTTGETSPGSPEEKTPMPSETPTPGAPVSSPSPGVSTTPTPAASETPEETFRLQIGSFQSRENAEAVEKELGAKGIRVVVEMDPTAEGGEYKVRSEGFKTREEAVQQAKILKGKGYDSVIVK